MDVELKAPNLYSVLEPRKELAQKKSEAIWIPLQIAAVAGFSYWSG